ncbi:SH3 domain-containing protein [Terrisporobacter sp.]|uniref:SH3 domain-containing protein n=1 Tax=Terrisporobacter sp. TaxID=1965305 RepID=UPI00261BBFA0|nr:SH3 domain-containing protein [Terrisporobacter sp.]
MLNKRIRKAAVVGALMIIMGAKEPIDKVDAAEGATGTVTASSLNVRSGASTSHKIVGKVKRGTEVEILSSDNGWYKIEYAGNKTGWSSGDYISKGTSSNGSSSTSASGTGTVTASSLNVRRGASTSNRVVGKLSRGTKVEILASNNGWYQIKYSGNKKGWVSGDYISRGTSSNNSSNTSTSTPASGTGTVTASSLNVRSGASTSNSIVGKLARGTKVEILASSNGWCQIKYAGNKTGWVSGSYISLNSSSSSSNSSLSVSSTLTVKSYAYTGGGITATGTKPKYGTIAVDPKVIPYGTKVYIKELDKVFTAEDTGGGIKGNKIDIYMPTESDCTKWGVRTVTLQILK